MKRTGGSKNPIVFNDYDSFVAKFTDKAKTTDDCYTPQDVYEAVVEYVKSIHDMTGKLILRPFYPGGDYENAEYPENGVVIDNPPFSIFTKICRWYSEKNIPFFLFGPGLTIGTIFDCCSAIIVGEHIKFSNGALVKCNFATNLIGDVLLCSSPRLTKMLAACDSQKKPERLPKYLFPDEVISVSKFQTIARGGGESICIYRDEAEVLRNLDLHPKRNGLFGNHLLVRSDVGERVKTAAAAAAAAAAIPIELSEREREIVRRL